MSGLQSMFTVLTYVVNDVNIDSPDAGAAGVSRLIFWEGHIMAYSNTAGIMPEPMIVGMPNSP